MKLDTAFEEPLEDDELLWSIEHWDRERIEAEDAGRIERMVEAFVHPRTGTAARILEDDDGEYSVQPSMGDFGPYDCVIQSDDPTEMVSGGSSVVAMEIETLLEARAIAYYWIRGWVQRNSSIGDSAGDLRDAER